MGILITNSILAFHVFYSAKFVCCRCQCNHSHFHLVPQTTWEITTNFSTNHDLIMFAK